MSKSKKAFQVGDRVAYSVAFLRSTGMTTGIHPRLRGTIREIQPFGGDQMCVIEWDNYRIESHYYDDGFGRVIAPNLTLVSRIAIDSALNT